MYNLYVYIRNTHVYTGRSGPILFSFMAFDYLPDRLSTEAQNVYPEGEGLCPLSGIKINGIGDSLPNKEDSFNTRARCLRVSGVLTRHQTV